MKIKKGNWSYNITDSRKQKIKKLIKQFNILGIQKKNLSNYLDITIARLIEKQKQQVENQKEVERYR